MPGLGQVIVHRRRVALDEVASVPALVLLESVLAVASVGVEVVVHVLVLVHLLELLQDLLRGGLQVRLNVFLLVPRFAVVFVRIVGPA